MAVIDFPNPATQTPVNTFSPTSTPSATANGVTYNWDGSKWVAQVAGGGGATDKIEEGNTSAEVIDTGSDGRFVVTTEGSERARVDSSGRLLVGSSSSDWTRPRVVIVGNPNETTTGAGVLYLQKANGTVIAGDKIGEIAFSTSSSNVGVYAEIICEGDATGGSADFPGRLVFKTCADGGSTTTERMRIHSNGRVGLGHAPQAVGHTLDVRNNEASLSALGVYQANTSFAQSSVFIDVNRATTNSSYNFLRCIQSGATDKLFIRDSGTVQNATGTYNTISDIKLKENIVDAPSQWDDIKNIRIRNYNFKPETNHQTHKQIGVVAQELELVCPGLVDEAPDTDAEGNDLGTTTKGVKASILYMKAVKALQEAMERIETLEAANTDLAARITALEGGN